MNVSKTSFKIVVFNLIWMSFLPFVATAAKLDGNDAENRVFFN